MKVVLPLNGGINKDANPLYIDAEKGEVIHRKNCRVTSALGGRDGINTSIKGMTEMTAMFPIGGTNKVIGKVEDKKRDQLLFFVYNSAGNHTIMRIKDGVVSDMNADADVLSFNTNEIIDADVLGDYLVFASDYNPPRKIRLVDDNDNPVSLSGLDSYDIQLAVRPPANKPAIQLASDNSKKVNKLIGKTFQFATMYIYDDYTYSVLSPYSDLAVSNSVFSAKDNTYTDNSIGNYVQVSYDLGTDKVRSVKLLAREGNIGSWFIVEEYEKNGEAEYATRTYPFYNDVARQALKETEALNLYSDVPKRARTVLAVQNRVGLGRVLKGYDKTNIQYTTSVQYEATGITAGTVTDLAVTSGYDVTYGFAYVEIAMPVSVSEGDVVSVFINGIYNGSVSPIYQLFYEYIGSYIVQSGDDVDDVRNYFYYDIFTKGNSIITDVTPESAFTEISSEIAISGGVRITISSDLVIPTGIFTLYATTATVTAATTGVNTYKGGSYYNVGVLLYDEFGRTSGVLSPQRVYVPHAGERLYADAYSRAKIAFSIEEQTVPSWVKYYRFAVTESVNFAGVYPFVTGNATDNIKQIYVDGKEVIAINMPTNLQYEFEKGDYLQIEVDSGAAITSTIVKDIIGTRTEIEVGGTGIAGFWLIVPAGTENPATYEENLAYIYRTKNVVQDLVYFEDSNTYTITNNTIAAATGYIGTGDAWYVLRKFDWETDTVDKVVEDFYLNVDSALRAYSKGRIVLEFDSLGEVLLQDFVWSLNYLDNTKINGISTFNPLNRKQLDEKDGDIQRIRLVGDVIKVVQDNKETSMYVGKAQVSDADGSLRLVKSNDFIGTVNPSEEDYGTRFPQSIVVEGRNMFYWDGDQGIVVQSSPNGQHEVSKYGMKSEFLRLKDLDASRVLAYYDKKNGEYVITFNKTGAVESWAYRDEANEWVMQIDLTDGSGRAAEEYGRIGTQCYAFLRSKVYSMETNNAHNTFFGAYKPLSVRGVINVHPMYDKCLKAVQMDSNRAMAVEIETPVTETNVVGQKTVLYKTTFRKEKGIYTSAVFKNILQAGGVENLALIHTGNDMVGKYIEIEFTDDTATEAQLRLVTVNLAVNG